MAYSVKVEIVRTGKSNICRAILEDLPQWFGISDARESYIAQSDKLLMFACYIEQEPVGFISLKVHNKYTAEIYVMGIKRKFHRRGVGTALLNEVLGYAKNEAIRLLTVKTLAPSHPDCHYAATRKFYEQKGFLPLEVFPTLWGPENPCLFMARPL